MSCFLDCESATAPGSHAPIAHAKRGRGTVLHPYGESRCCERMYILNIYLLKYILNCFWLTVEARHVVSIFNKPIKKKEKSAPDTVLGSLNKSINLSIYIYT